jgi:hypothetical protein
MKDWTCATCDPKEVAGDEIAKTHLRESNSAVISRTSVYHDFRAPQLWHARLRDDSDDS